MGKLQERLRGKFYTYCKESGVDLEEHVLLPAHLATIAAQELIESSDKQLT